MGYIIACIILLIIPFCFTGIGVYKAIKSKCTDWNGALWALVGAAVSAASLQIIGIFCKCMDL